MRRCSSGSSLGFGRTGPSPPYGQGAVTTNRRLSLGGARPFQLSPQGSSEAAPHFVNHFHTCTSQLSLYQRDFSFSDIQGLHRSLKWFVNLRVMLCKNRSSPSLSFKFRNILFCCFVLEKARDRRVCHHCNTAQLRSVHTSSPLFLIVWSFCEVC